MAADVESTCLQALFPEGVIALAGDPEKLDGALFPEEQASIARAARKRVQEFTAGRVLARRALEILGCGAMPLPARKDRTPAWPAGAIGSITHTRGFCGVAVALRSRVRGIGLDAERAADLKDELVPRVCTAREREWLARQPEQSRGSLAKLLFSAKECVYKAQYALTGKFLGFQQVEIEVDVAGRAFLARIEGTALPVSGRFSAGTDLVLTGATI